MAPGYWEVQKAGAQNQNTGGTTDKHGLDWDFWNYGDTTKTWAPDPMAFQYGMGVPQGWNQGAAQMSGMQFGQDQRADQMAMQQLLMQRAQGQNLASAAMAQQQLEQGQGAIASRAAAAQRGGYDPATARDALYATGALGGQVAGSAAIAAAQEQMAAAQAAGQMATAGRGLDIQQGLGAQQLAMQLRQMGLQDKWAEWQARQAYENAKKAGYFGVQESVGAGAQLFAGTAALGTGLITKNPEAAKAAYDAAMNYAQADK